MGIVEFVNHLQEKPERVRRRILTLAIIVIMTGIIALWVSVSGRELLTIPSTKPDNTATPERSALTPFEVLGESLRDAWHEIVSYLPIRK